MKPTKLTHQKRTTTQKKGRKMASITVRGKRRKTYRITVSLGFKPDGRQNLKTTTFIPPPGLTEKQGRKAAEAFKAKYEVECKGLTNFDDSMTLNELTKWYFDTIAPDKLRLCGLESRRGALARHILPKLGSKRLRELTPALLSSHIAELRGVVGLSGVTVNNLRMHLSAVFTAAVKKKIITSNPLRDVDALRVETKKQAVLTPAQVKTFIAGLVKVENIGVRGLLLTQLFTGARPGELRALTWADINFEKGLIDINKGVDGKGRVAPPKSKSSYRVLCIAPLLLNFLIQHRRDVEYLAAGMGSAWTEHNLVFPNPQGGYLHHCTYAREIKKIIAGTDIPPDFHAHSLRHTLASLMIKEGTDIKTVQANLGHGSAKMTLDIYSHSFAEARAAAMDNTADVIGKAVDGAIGTILIPKT